jgi:hypothetical protein
MSQKFDAFQEYLKSKSLDEMSLDDKLSVKDETITLGNFLESWIESSDPELGSSGIAPQYYCRLIVLPDGSTWDDVVGHLWEKLS